MAGIGQPLRAHTMVTDRMERERTRWRRAMTNAETPKNGHPAGLAKMITEYLSALVTAELTVNISGGRRARWLQRQFDTLRPMLQQGVELAAAEGICALRPRVQGKNIYLDLIPGRQIYPTRLDQAGNPEAGFFADFRRTEDREVVRLEEFDWDGGTLTVKNRAFLRKGDVLEREIPLDSLEAWKDLENETEIMRAGGPLFGVIRMPFGAGTLPESIYAGALESFGEFDRLFGELLYELHSGKRKRILERQALPGLLGKKVPGSPDWQDLTADTYLVLDPMEQQKPFDDYSPVLRTEGYLAALGNLLELIENQCHLSPGALRLSSGGPVTATEIVSRDRTTYHTCAAIQEQGLRPAIERLLAAMDALADLYGLCPPGEYEAVISFGDSVFEDTGTEFDRQLRLAQAGFLKPERLLGWYFHVDAETAKREYLQKEDGNGGGNPNDF